MRINREAPFLCRGAAVPRYYGFTPIALRSSRELREQARSLAVDVCESDVVNNIEDAVALLRHYEEEKMERLPQPVMFCRVVPARLGAIGASGGRAARSAPALRLDLLGSSKSIAEALLLHATLQTVLEYGATGACIRINSVGDRESFGRFTRELAGFYRKRLDALNASCRDALRASPFPLLQCEHEACRAFRAEAPRTLSFLSEEARTHFKEVLEYLEALHMPYELHEHLVGITGISSHTVFEIRDAGGALMGVGYRYNHLARRVGARREIPALGALLFLPAEAFAPARRERERVPQVYFIQLGETARRKSLLAIELLRRVGIPIAQSLGSDKIAAQLAHADALQTPFLVIMGHKEALEDSALVRDRERSFQETLPLSALPSYLSRLLA